MPSLEHNAIVSLFRDNPPLAPHVVETLFGMTVPVHSSVAVVESSLDELVPVEFRADLVLELRDKLGARMMSCIIEVQRDVDRKKERSWPVYAAVERSRKDCPAIVLVVATNEDVAVWASRTIDLGLGLHVMRPLVLGPRGVPVVTDREVAKKEPELAILSALLHADGPRAIEVVTAVFGAFEQFDREQACVYFNVVYNHLRGPVRQAFERLIMERANADEEIVDYARIPLEFFQRLPKGFWTDIADRMDELQRQLREHERIGERKGLRDTLLRQLKRAAIEVTDEECTLVQECTSIETLDRWLDNVIGAKTAADVFK